MAILVDPGRWPHRGGLWCHLVSDTSFDELHIFARSLGLPRVAFQGDHYDLDEVTRLRAVSLGATEVNAREVVRALDTAGLRRGPAYQRRGLDGVVHLSAPRLLTERLELRQWSDNDRAPFATLNADPDVSKWLGGPLSREQSDAMIDRHAVLLALRGFGLWAVHRRVDESFDGAVDRALNGQVEAGIAGAVGGVVEAGVAGPVDGEVEAGVNGALAGAPEPVLEGTFVGAIGLNGVSSSFPFGPALELAWRIDPRWQGYGFATEAARAAAEYASNSLDVHRVAAFTSVTNSASQRVMDRLGMSIDETFQNGEFDHPNLSEGHPLRRHVLRWWAAPTTRTISL